MKTTAIAVLAAFAMSAAGAAQMYRWVDDKGNVEYRDTPPPSSAKKIERRELTGNTIETSTLPYSVQLAVKNNPVTLWAGDCGEPCTQARAHLARRGVPHTERNPQRESEALKKATGALDVPVLIVGTSQLKGYLESTWDAALDSAGYPRTAPPGVKPRPKGAAEQTPTKAPPTPPAASK